MVSGYWNCIQATDETELSSSSSLVPLGHSFLEQVIGPIGVDPLQSHTLPVRLMVGHMPLEHVIGVRVPDWQLEKTTTHQCGCFHFKCQSGTRKAEGNSLGDCFLSRGRGNFVEQKLSVTESCLAARKEGLFSSIF